MGLVTQGPHDGAGMPDGAVVAVADLVAVMDRLRSPGGCPWDAEQTAASLAQYAVEEVFEVVEAVETGDRAALREELGDLLLQVVFQARVAQEHPTEPFGLAEVAAGIAEKLRRRHPHVFADALAHDPAAVHEQWERIKAAEKGRASAFDGVPVALPALQRAQKVLGRAERLGAPAAFVEPVGPVERDGVGGGIGEALLDLVRQARAAGVDAEGALRAELRRVEGELRAWEAGEPGEPGRVPMTGTSGPA